MLALAGENTTTERIEPISYEPGGAQDSGNLEAGTSSITATTRPGSPNYTAVLTVPAPGDDRVQVVRLGLRVAITIDAITAGSLSYAVAVNGADRTTGSLTGTGTHTVAVDLTPGQFSLGVSSTVTVYLWVDSGNATLSACEVWLGVGTCSNDYFGQECLTLAHRGLASCSSRLAAAGASTAYASQTITDGTFDQGNVVVGPGGSPLYGSADATALVQEGMHLRLSSSVAGALTLAYAVRWVVRIGG